MIKCKVCEKYQGEEMFSRYNYTSICWGCRETEAGKKLMRKIDDNILESMRRQDEYDAKKRECIKNQVYEGQYDWM